MSVITHLRIFIKMVCTKPFGSGQFSEAPTGFVLQNCPQSGTKGRQGACTCSSKIKIQVFHHQIQDRGTLSSSGRRPCPGILYLNPSIINFYKVHYGWDIIQENRSCPMKHHAGKSRTLYCPWKLGGTLVFQSRLP